MDFVIQKRERTRNFTEAEKKLLLDIVQRHLAAVEDKSSKCKIKIWQHIGHEFNSAAIFGFRTWKQLRYLYKNMKKGKPANGSYKKTATSDGMPALRLEDNCSSNSSVYYEEMPVIIESDSRKDSVNEISLSDSDPLANMEPSSACLTSRVCRKSVRKTANCGRNTIPEYTLKNITRAEDILWRRLELRFKQEIHDHKLKAMEAIHAQELRAKQEIHEQELLLRREDHEFERNVRQKLLELESENWTKRNKLLDFEIALKERQLNK